MNSVLTHFNSIATQRNNLFFFFIHLNIFFACLVVCRHFFYKRKATFRHFFAHKAGGFIFQLGNTLRNKIVKLNFFLKKNSAFPYIRITKKDRFFFRNYLPNLLFFGFCSFFFSTFDFIYYPYPFRFNSSTFTFHSLFLVDGFKNKSLQKYKYKVTQNLKDREKRESHLFFFCCTPKKKTKNHKPQIFL